MTGFRRSKKARGFKGSRRQKGASRSRKPSAKRGGVRS